MIGRSLSRPVIQIPMPRITPTTALPDRLSDLSAITKTIRRRLLAWYDSHHRDLPWRVKPSETPDPYCVLVSEAMLQQTQVATVLPYYVRFIEAFPTVRDLAGADEQAVLRLWQGLGYYRRARNLHAAARVIVDDHGAVVPGHVGDLLSLPGVGRYTAGAIASIAYGRAAPILDGNVARVLSRLFLINQPVDAHDTRKTLWRLAEELVPSRRPGDFNQAVMELGALVCTKANPSCSKCPLSSDCVALRDDRVAEVPVPAKRKTPLTAHHHIIAIERRGRFLFEKRPTKGLWSNMWQIPTSEDLSAKVKPAALRAWTDSRFGLSTDELKDIGSFTHQTTHRTIEFHVWHAPVTSGRLRPRSGLWRSLTNLNDLPLANPQRRVVTMLID
jgi:A/G-specific adenine glycosylase